MKLATSGSEYIIDDEFDKKRRISVIQFILSISLILSASAFVLALIDITGKHGDYRGIPLTILILPVLFFSSLFYILRTKFYWTAAYGLIIFYFLCATFTVYQWGFILPTGLLVYALIAVMCGVLINSLAGILTSISIFCAMLLIAHLQETNVISPDLYWLNNVSVGTDDVLVYVFILAVITAVAWLSNREIDKSLRRARESELALKHERDQLEIKVKERTRELQQTQMEQMTQLYRFAELGQLSAGLLHDIANPLTTVSLNLEQLEIERRSQLVKRARQGIKQMQDYIVSARRQLQSESAQKEFSAMPEIKSALTMLNYRLRKEHITVDIVEKHKLKLLGNEVRFQQLITNLVANAIEAYTDSITPTRSIVITISMEGRVGHISIKDSGRGMKSEDIKKAFEAFYTTKSKEGGMGLGLAICRDIMQKEFHGTIQLTSPPKQGTTALLTFPLAP